MPVYRASDRENARTVLRLSGSDPTSFRRSPWLFFVRNHAPWSGSAYHFLNELFRRTQFRGEIDTRK